MQVIWREGCLFHVKFGEALINRMDRDVLSPGFVLALCDLCGRAVRKLLGSILSDGRFGAYIHEIRKSFFLPTVLPYKLFTISRVEDSSSFYLVKDRHSK